MARYDLELSDDEYGESTPYQLEALFDRYRERQKREEMLTGVIAAAVVNAGFARPERPVSAMDFFKREDEAPPKPQSIESFIDSMKRMFPAEAGAVTLE